MALIETKCPNCGANLVADNSKKEISCIYCHTNFMATVEPKSGSADTDMSENSNDTSEELIDRADTFLYKLNLYDKAYELYNEYALLHPEDYRGWWGIASVLSEDFTKLDCSPEEYEQIEKNATLAFKVAEDHRDELEAKWNEYCSQITEEISSDHKYKADTIHTFDLSADKKNLQKQLDDVNTKLSEISKELEEFRENYKPISKTKKTLSIAFAWANGVSLIPLALDKKKKKKLEKLAAEEQELLELKIKLEQELKNKK